MATQLQLSRLVPGMAHIYQAAGPVGAVNGDGGPLVMRLVVNINGGGVNPQL